LCISEQTFLNLNSDELGWLRLTDNYVWSALGFFLGDFCNFLRVIKSEFSDELIKIFNA
jgi:hypothetical protein